MNSEELAEKLLPYWQEFGINITQYDKKYLSAIAALEKDRLKKLSEIGERTKYFFEQPEFDSALLVWKKSDKEKTKKILFDLANMLNGLNDTDFDKEQLEKNIKNFISAENLDNGSVLWPLRVALTGLEKSPGPFEVAWTIAQGPGKAEIVNRLNFAQKKLLN
jgi:glutamyl-tRNA synthetase